MLNQRWARIASSIMSLYEQLDRDVASFAAKAGMHCPPGCGACCLSPHVECTVAEMLPLAILLFEKGEVETFIKRLQQGSSICAQYEALPDQSEKGRCRNYGQRPVLCRLFGYVGSRDKNGQARYGACRVLQKMEAERIQAIETELQNGRMEIPFFAPAHERIMETAGSLAEAILPINQALMRAIEMVGLSQQLEADGTGGHQELWCS